MSLVAYTRKKTNVKRAPRLVKKNPFTPERILVYIGKPFYLSLIILSIGSLWIVALIGYNTRIAVIKFTQQSLLLSKYLHKNLRGLRLRKNKFDFKKVQFPKIHFRVPQYQILFKSFVLKRRSFKFRFSFLVKTLMAIFLAFFSFALIFWSYILRDLPSPHDLNTRNIEVSTKIYDRYGKLLYKIFKDENRTIVKLQDIPIHVRNATLAAEDAEFYEHPGFSVRGITRSIFRNLKKGELTGGSTITQQLVKNALLTPEKTLTRKLKEIALSVRVELTFSKDEILEMYLNEVSYGGTAYGIEEASEAYFGKKVKDLTLSEASYLAGLPKRPSTYASSPEVGIARQKDVLRLMKINKFITEEEKLIAEKEKMQFASPLIDIKAPHFVMYVRNQLADKYGEEVVETGGLEVYTTIDYDIQKLAEEVVKKEVDNLKNMRVGNGAVVILDPKSGEILAMVGSKDYFDVKNDGNVNVTTRPRSPGSSIKIVNYAYALSQNYTPASIIDDAPISFNIPGQPPYKPKNYDNSFHGKVTLRNSFAQSLNIPAVKVLNSYGVKNMLAMGKKLGITTWENESRFGLSLTLGGGEVKLLELANVYATVANYGRKSPLTSIKKITNYKGRVLEDNACTTSPQDFRKFLVNKITAHAAEAMAKECEGEEVLDPRVSYQLIDILKDNNARSPSFGRASQLVIKNHPEVGVKTGTSNDLKDNLTVGFTKDYVVAVWVGNNDGSPMSRIASGLTGASTIFNKIMTPLLSEKESYAWSVPPGLTEVAICPYTGTLSCQGCPSKKEWFLSEKKPTHSCSSEQIASYLEDKNPSEGELLDSGLFTQWPF